MLISQILIQFLSVDLTLLTDHGYFFYFTTFVEDSSGAQVCNRTHSPFFLWGNHLLQTFRKSYKIGPFSICCPFLNFVNPSTECA